jgi:putative transcriptional regulator
MKGLNLTGSIIVSQPRSEEPYFSKGVIIIAKHSSSGAWGLMVNKPAPKLALDQIMQSIGIMSKKQDKVYIGGPVDTHRVHILHSLDWRSSTTMEITPDIGVTNDMSVMAAIAENEGPALFRTCVGTSGWGPGQLDGEHQGNPPWNQANRWLDAPATIESVFNLTGEEQWHRSIEIVAQSKISKWL